MNIVYFDLETQKSAQEVGGWNNKHLMRLSIGVTYSTRDDMFKVFEEDDLPALISELTAADQVIGYNLLGFDYAVLSAYSPFDFFKLPTLDLMADLSRILGFRLKLDSLAQATLNAAKSADGLAAIRWFQERNMAQIALYCREDVRLTRDLHRFGQQQGCVYYLDRQGKRIPVPVSW